MTDEEKRRGDRRLAASVASKVMQKPLRIGISARIFHPESGTTGLRSKNLQYPEVSMAHWVMTRDALVFMVPTGSITAA